MKRAVCFSIDLETHKLSKSSGSLPDAHTHTHKTSHILNMQCSDALYIQILFVRHSIPRTIPKIDGEIILGDVPADCTFYHYFTINESLVGNMGCPKKPG